MLHRHSGIEDKAGYCNEKSSRLEIIKMVNDRYGHLINKNVTVQGFKVQRSKVIGLTKISTFSP